jgi:hypothetical protein
MMFCLTQAQNMGLKTETVSEMNLHLKLFLMDSSLQ